MIHEFKIQSKFYKEIESGVKTFEVRKNDRPGGFRVGDILGLNEIDEHGNYTRRCLLEKVTYVLDDDEYCKEGYVVLGIEQYKSFTSSTPSYPLTCCP